MSTPAAPRSPHPWAFHLGPAHVIVHASAAFREAFGTGVVGMPAREALLAWPPEAFALMDRVYHEGRALARRVRTPAGDRRLVVTARRDPETGETYGVTSHLRPLPVPRAPG